MPVAIRFFAVPAHRLAANAQPSSDEFLEPALPPVHEAVERALGSAEFRDVRARDRLRALLESDRAPALSTSGAGDPPAAVFAEPPRDLPALLRLADELESLAKREAGERALVWKCTECGARYAVPVALVRAVSIRCERCGKAVELNPRRSLGEEALIDPLQGAINAARHELAGFFREAMARGWPVLVSSAP